MPEPHKGESRDDFVSRCMADPEQRKSFPDEKQCAAVCNSKWEEKNKKAEQRRLMPASPQWLRAGGVSARPGKVDRQAGIIHGYCVAQLGVFKDRRGEFDEKGLKQIAAMMNLAPKGTKSRFTHPTLSEDGLGKYLGRSRDARVEGDKVRADLHLSPTSRNTPSGDLGGYVMDLAESDPGAFGSSLVLKPREEMRLAKDGRPVTDTDGEPLPSLWYPEEIHASDVVEEGDAVHDGFLSVPGELRAVLLRGELPDDFVRQGSALLDSVFAGQDRGVVAARVSAWLERYLTLRYGAPAPTPKLDARLARLDALAEKTLRPR